MSLTRRSLFGVLAGAAASLGLAKVAVPAEAKGFRLGRGTPVPAFNPNGRLGIGGERIYDPQWTRSALTEALAYMRTPGTRALMFVPAYHHNNLHQFVNMWKITFPERPVATWEQRDHAWVFSHPSGADSCIVFDTYDVTKRDDYLRHMGSAYHYIGWDDAVDLPLEARAYLRTRLRRLKGGPAVALHMYRYGDPPTFT